MHFHFSKNIVFSSPSGPTAEALHHQELPTAHTGHYLPLPYETNYHVSPTAHEHSSGYHTSYGTGPEGTSYENHVSHSRKGSSINKYKH